jgi:small membrane protein
VVESIIIQLILIAFALFALTRAILRYKNNEITFAEFIFWAIVWVGVIIMSLMPKLLGGVADFLGVSSGISLLVYISIILLFYLVFRAYVRLDHQDQKITQLIRELTITKALKKKK